MKIEIDSKSGFCFGVINAIEKAEEELQTKGILYCLGDIVHNGVEVRRLEAMGLKTITHLELKELKDCTVLLRAHGEPPSTYELAEKNNIKLIDATCPVVLSLQKKIKRGYNAINKEDGQIVIFGKHGHAEVNGLVGQTNENAIVVNSKEDLSKVDFSKPIHIFSQTTQSQHEYKDLQEEMKSRIVDEGFDLKSTNSICRQVSNRENDLRDFAQKFDVVVFVSGKKSSNGKVLYNICHEVNQYTYFVSDVVDLEGLEITKDASVGICGATSTPKWLMEKVADEIHRMFG